MLWNLLLTAISCSTPESDLGLGNNPLLSGCGGFTDELDRHYDSDTKSCGDDRLIWGYDSTTQTATFMNEGVFLNCCGLHSISITQQTNGTYVITQIDEPEIDDGHELRCGCMCLFDYGISLHDVPEESIPIQIVRYVPDNNPNTWTAWEGTLDLSEGNGEVLIQADVGWCD